MQLPLSNHTPKAHVSSLRRTPPFHPPQNTSPLSLSLSLRNRPIHHHHDHHISMDSLFDTINVRDLLSAHDLSDPSSPLSAPDLRLLIQRLESHSLQIRSKVQSYLLSHRDNFESLFSLSSDAVSQSQLLSSDLAGILKLISDQPIDAEVREVVKEMREKREELKVKRELLGLVRTVVGVCERLESVREGLRNGRFGFAAEGLKELKVALRVSNGDGRSGGVEDGEPLVYGLLRKEWSQCFDEVL